jgi:Zn-dependent protease with chaperone function
LAFVLASAAAQANPLVDKIVEQLEASPSGCAALAEQHPQRRLIETDVAEFKKVAPIPPGVDFQVMDCVVDGFVHKGRTIVVSTRMARLSAPQRFFILAHELGHLKLAHHMAISSFVARMVGSAPDESAARAAIAAGLSPISHRAELDADAFAVRLMREAGHDPEHAARLFDSIGEGADNTTHPSAGRRARSIRTAQ